MAQDPNQNRAAPVKGSEPKSPLDRAKQVEELRRAAEAAASRPAAVGAAGGPAALQAAQAAVADGLQKAAAVFVVKPVEQVSLHGPDAVKTDTQAYGAKQVDESSLFGNRKSDDIEVAGPVWKVIPFGPPQISALLDTKKPGESFDIHIPKQTVKHKDGNLFQITATPKAGGEPPIKKAVLTDPKGNIRGIEVKNTSALERALAEIPTFAQNLFRSVFGDGVKDDDPAKHQRIVKVEPGKKSTYTVTLERKNVVNGTWKTETVPVNNFGLRVPESNDPRRHDIIVAMYYLDRFQAA